MKVADLGARICILGEHVDHQLGQVSGMALDKRMWVAYAPRIDDTVRVQSLAFPGTTYQFSLSDIPAKMDEWYKYAAGAAWALKQDKRLKDVITTGVELVVATDIPIAAGLSTSAAVGVGYQTALLDVNNLLLGTMTIRDRILLDQALENGYLELQNGILDQSLMLLSRKNCSLTVHFS